MTDPTDLSAIFNFSQLSEQYCGHFFDFEQVFRNLIVNAAQAMELSKEKRLHISLQTSADGKRIVVRMADTGAGIAPEFIDKIFQPFFTTKTDTGDKGTGLGLPIVKTILDRHQASIEVES